MNLTSSTNALFHYATEGILLINDSGTILLVNPSAEKVFGYTSEELVGKKIEVLVPTHLAKKHVEHRAGFHSAPHPRSMGVGLELFALRKDGSEFPVEISLSPYSTEEGNHVIVFVADITLRYQAERQLKEYSAELDTQVKKRTLILEEAMQELEKTKNELNSALEKEKELSELKSRFVSMASHEFRTPLATMLSSLSLMKRYSERNDTEKIAYHFGKMRASINDLTIILDDFLSLSKLEEGKIENQPGYFHLPNFIRLVCDEMHSLLKKDQQILSVHNGIEEVCLDKKLMKNILYNLISNAIKFSDEAKPITILSAVGESDISITVQDSGIGIPDYDQKHLFERFFRGNNVAHIQGTGLGLNIVARYVELMNGSISFESKENLGSTFTVVFSL